MIGPQTFPAATVENRPTLTRRHLTRHFASGALLYAFIILVSSFCPAQEPSTPNAPAQPGTITGTVVDKDGAVIAGASITLKQPETPTQKVISAGDGTFGFSSVHPGPFELTVDAVGFATEKTSGTLQPGLPYWSPPIQMRPAARIEVEAAETQEQIAAEQLHVEEQQNVLGFIPNYYVSYESSPVALTVHQKYQLAFKSAFNPLSFGIAAVAAAVEQADNFYSGYGQGWQGYGKRLGATYADSVSGTFIGQAILPSILKQDPRYYWKGVGTGRSRFLYALASSFRCKGDNGKWQPNYSNMLGDLASGGLSNAYYPASNRNGVGLTFANAAIGIGEGSIEAVFQEFVVRKFTPHLNRTPQN